MPSSLRRVQRQGAHSARDQKLPSLAPEADRDLSTETDRNRGESRVSVSSKTYEPMATSWQAEIYRPHWRSSPKFFAYGLSGSTYLGARAVKSPNSHAEGRLGTHQGGPPGTSRCNITSCCTQELRDADARLGPRDLSAAYRIALRHRIKELEEIERTLDVRVHDSKVRAWNMITGVLIGLLVAGLARLFLASWGGMVIACAIIPLLPPARCAG